MAKKKTRRKKAPTRKRKVAKKRVVRRKKMRRRSQRVTAKMLSSAIKRARKEGKTVTLLSRRLKLAQTKTRDWNRKADKMFKAMKPGKRVTSHGSVYYERRRNRSDKKPRTRL
jgi:hypothetical protein